VPLGDVCAPVVIHKNYSFKKFAGTFAYDIKKFSCGKFNWNDK
jgi:hypothetical protein